MKTIILVPTYNESASIIPLARKIAEFVPSAHLLVIDDNSPDGTAATARPLQFRPRLRQLPSNVPHGPRGLGRAYRDGFAQALAQGYDLIVRWTPTTPTIPATSRN